MLFKKPVPQGARNLIGNKDRKKLQRAVVQCYPACNDELFDNVLFPKGQEITAMKVQGSKILIYLSQGEPIFFDADGSGNLYPTVCALSRCPHIIPSFLVPTPVSQFVLGGADLMVPGILKPLDVSCFGDDGLLINKKMGVRVVGNEVPFAVGRCTINNSNFNQGKGRALETLHVFGDFLWSMGSKLIPNDGFSLKLICPTVPSFLEDICLYPAFHTNNKTADGYDIGATADSSPIVSPTALQQCPASLNAEDNESDDGWADSPTCISGTCQVPATPPNSEAVSSQCENFKLSIETDQVDAKAPSPEEAPACTVSVDVKAPSSEEAPACTNDSANVAVMLSGGLQSRKASVPELPENAELPPSAIDAFLELALLEVLHTEVPDSACPMQVSGLLSKMMQCCAPLQFCPTFRQRLCEDDVLPQTARAITNGMAIVTCDVKKSTHKKLSKFIQFYEKNKLLQSKEVRGNLLLVFVNREVSLYKTYTPLSEKEKKYAHKLSLSMRPSQQSSEQMSATQTQIQFEVIEFYLPSNDSIHVFENAKMSPGVAGKYFLPAQCKEALMQYLKTKTPVASKPSAGVLNELLQRCVLSKDERNVLKGQSGNPELEKADIMSRFLRNMQVFHAVTRADVDPRIDALVIRIGKIQPIMVRYEKRQGKKVVTTVAHIQAFSIDEKQLAEILSKSLATSATTFELTGAAKGKVKPLGVLVQGAFANEISDILTNQFSVPRKFICTPDDVKRKKI